ncbi:MAG: tRNA pseudouridine(55) synthase TruB [Burkholderiaceae bacterium]|jgi:tRNA pseudouridine55 synthase
MQSSPVDGILLLDKPLGLTSNAALARVKRALGAAKGGHTGTLDPLASGLLPVCLGEATKFASDLLDADKSYTASLRLGSTTTTGDAEGEVLETRPVRLRAEQIEVTLAQFRGPIEQVPPMYSALKRDGRALYHYARAGITLERAARPVTIHELHCEGFEADVLKIAVCCSKGTYIRTLAEDIGRALGCGAHLQALRRTGVGHLRLADATALFELESLDGPQCLAKLLPVDALVQSLPSVRIGSGETTRFTQGQVIQVDITEGEGRVRVYTNEDETGQFLGVGQLRGPGILAPLRLLATRA